MKPGEPLSRGDVDRLRTVFPGAALVIAALPRRGGFGEAAFHVDVPINMDGMVADALTVAERADVVGAVIAALESLRTRITGEPDPATLIRRSATPPRSRE